MAANKYGNAANALYPGDVLTVWDAEAAVTGDRSQAIAIAESSGPNNGAAALSVEVHFSADPGAFTLDFQDASSDADAAYQNVAACHITAVDANFYARADFALKAPLGRLKLTLLTNAVNVTAKVSQ